jgi:hypothetical protein
MATSQYFNHFSHAGEQKLISDLVTEFIQQRGVDAYYIVRELVDEIEMFNEAEFNNFKDAKSLEFYLESITNFNGEGDLFSKFGGFGFEDTATLMYSQARFAEEMVGLRTEPTPGDLVYVPYTQQFYEVQKRLQDEDFRQVGVNRVWRVRVVKFKYGHEDFDTGIQEIDDLETVVDTVDPDDATVTRSEDPRDKRDEVKTAPVSSSIVETRD